MDMEMDNQEKEHERKSIAQRLEGLVALKQKKMRAFTAANYKKVAQSVCTFLGERADRCTLEELTSRDVAQYIEHLENNRKLCINSVAFYGGTFRAMYNHSFAHLSEWESGKNPFSALRLRHTETIKRTLSVSEMEALIGCDLSAKPELAKSRDLFLFLFLTCGMCFVDVYHLQKQAISGGYINYMRSKTQRPLRVKINGEIQELLDRYGRSDSPYLFPFLHEQLPGFSQTLGETSSLRRLNRHLTKLGKLLTFALPLTTYCARHSWASFAEASGVSISIISQALGHASEQVTRTYLKGLPSHIVDEANEFMLNFMVRKKKQKPKPKQEQKPKLKEEPKPKLKEEPTLKLKQELKLKEEQKPKRGSKGGGKKKKYLVFCKNKTNTVKHPHRP